MEEQNKLIVFENKDIRRIWHNEEWWFAVVDVVGAISESKNPAVYWRVLKKRLKDEGAEQTVTNCNGLKMEALDGKMRKTDCANTQTLLRIVQSIPSKKAEPFKQWLAEVGYERIQEIENPALAGERMRLYYKDKGYSDDWIAKRLQSVDVRGKLTDEWQERGVKQGFEYSILTAEISRATFGMSPSEYKQYKDLKRENLRDHMSDLELIFTMLGETATKKEAQDSEAQGFDDNKKAAIRGGSGAGDALQAYENSTGQKVVTDKNFKKQIAEAKKERKRLEAEQKRLEEKSEEE